MNMSDCASPAQLQSAAQTPAQPAPAAAPPVVPPQIQQNVPPAMTAPPAVTSAPADAQPATNGQTAASDSQEQPMDAEDEDEAKEEVSSELGDREKTDIFRIFTDRHFHIWWKNCNVYFFYRNKEYLQVLNDYK